MAAVKPSPAPAPARTVVVVLALVRVVLALTLPLGRALLAAAEALPYLGFAALWVISAAAAARVAGSRACDEGSAPAVFLQALADGALKASLLVLQALGPVMLCGQFLLYVVAAVSGPGSEFRKRAHGAFNPELIRGVPPRTAVLGAFASTPFILLVLAGSLVQCTMSKKIGSVMLDVGIFGFSAIPCFVVIPAVVLSNWREDQMSKKNTTHESQNVELVFDSWASGTVPVMEPPPPPAGPQPVLPTFEEFVAQRFSTPGPRSTGGSSVGGGGGGRESRSPIATPIHRGGGGAESPRPITPIHRGSGAGSSDDLGFGDLGGDELGGGRPSV